LFVQKQHSTFSVDIYIKPIKAVAGHLEFAAAELQSATDAAANDREDKLIGDVDI